MNFRPLPDRVIIRRLDTEGSTHGGVIISDIAQKRPIEGQVVAVGVKARNMQGAVVARDVEVDDRIQFQKRSDIKVTSDGAGLMIMKESDIPGVLIGIPAAPHIMAR